MMWYEATADLQSTTVLEILEPCEHIGKTHAAKQSQDMLRSIERDCDWFSLATVFREGGKALAGSK